MLLRLGRRHLATWREGWLALLNSLTLITLALALMDSPGWSGPWVVILFAATLALLTALWWQERRPLLTAEIAPPISQTLATGLSAGGDPGVQAGLHEAIAAVAVLLNQTQDLNRALTAQQALLARLEPQRNAQARFAPYDPLTGLATHTAFMTRLSQDVAFAAQHGRPLALAIFDVTGFRQVNRTHGYRVGDEVLIAVAERIRLAMDADDLVGHLGGDRFGVAWANLGHNAALARIEQVIHLVTRQPLSVPQLQAPIQVAMRAGVAVCPDDGVAAHALLELAADALRGPRAARQSPPASTPNLPTPPVGAPLIVAGEHADFEDNTATALPALPPALPSPHSYLQELVQRHTGIHALTSALEARNPLSVAQARNLGELAEETALLLGRSIEEARLVGLAVLLHDVGELGIAPEVLSKVDPLTPEEWSFVREHPRLGERLLNSVGGVLAAVAPMVASHRERWDGSGYPDHLANEAIPLGARIVAICDVFGALISERPYRRPFSIDEALDEIQRCAGTQFDPQVVTAFLQAARL